MEAKIYNQDGKPEGMIDLSESIFHRPWNADLVHQVVTGMQANARSGRAHTKDRGEVRGGGKKPWRQKGTGRARHGSIRSPLWRGGGVTHGPRTDRLYHQKINKKMKRQALAVVLSAKLRAGDILFLKDLQLAAAKTQKAQTVIKALSRVKGFNQLNYRRGQRAVIALPERNQDLQRSFRNLPAVAVEEVRNLNPLALLRYRYLVVVDPVRSLEALYGRK
ncbi:MAG: 50S ribosomal protein L4 [Candidatus Vogelbacteria bacterium]|nr:50S ribosomal protein L4 [Candidatus Vogelbacteria bacterium]